MSDPKPRDLSFVNRRGRPSGQRIMFRELQRRSRWYVGLRWWVPPAICLGVGLGWALNYRFAWLPILCVAAGIGAYNLALAAWARRLAGQRDLLPTSQNHKAVQRFTHWQVILDYAAVFALVHFTGGIHSPLIPILLFHIICASILLRPRAAYLFAGLVALGLAIVVLGADLGWWTPLPLAHASGHHTQGTRSIPTLVFSTVVALGTAFLATSIMSVLRARVKALDRAHSIEADLNEKLNALYEMIQAIVADKALDEVLSLTKHHLTTVMAVRAIAIKLLSEDGRLLRYAAVEGLPDGLDLEKVIAIDKSPLNRRVLDGEPFVTGDLSEKQMFQFGEDLSAAGLRSVLFVPLRTEEGVIGILGAYCSEPDRFSAADVSFFRLVADLVAIAIENARSFEAIEHLLRDRSKFMLRVAHNLKAPMGAITSMVELLRGSYLGAVTPDQRDYLDRIERRAAGMVEMIRQLLLLAEDKARDTGANKMQVDLNKLLTDLEYTFRHQAEAKGLALGFQLNPDLPAIEGDPAMLQDMVENLVSNAIKYTPAGRIDVRLTLRTPTLLCLEVSDTGIGIPDQALPDLFTEFFRAGNARDLDPVGTGLGLALVRQVAERHRGRVEVSSHEGEGSTFRVLLPVEEEA